MDTAERRLHAVAAPGDDGEHAVSGFRFSEGRSRSNASVSASARESHREQLAEWLDRRLVHAVTARGHLDGERDGAESREAPLSREVRHGSRFVRASLVGIAPGGVRARRLGKSQGRERRTIRHDGRVLGTVDASL
jgi:hypothetical protein